MPAKLDGVKSDSSQVYKYLDEHKWELEYQLTITGEDHSCCLVFAQFATRHMRDKLRIYHPLLEVQERRAGDNIVVVMEIGTLIRLLS